MTSKISLKNIALKFIKHTNRSNSIKENVIRFLLNFGKPSYAAEDFWVFRNMNLDLHQGDRLGIIGINGAGKTSLLKLISGIYTPTEGQARIQGRISSLIEIGAGFDSELTGRENIYLNGLISGFSKKEIKQKEKAIIDFSGLEEFIDTPIKYYSTGMGLRLGFSIATSINPEILIFDELFAGGDINFIEKATAKLNEIIYSSHIFITVSHDNDYVRRFCNKVLYIKNHGIAYFGDDVEFGIGMYVGDSKTVAFKS